MARKLTGRRVIAGVLFLIVAGIGCNPLLVPTYLFQGFKQGKIESQFNFYDKAHGAKKKKEIKVVVLTELGRGLSYEFVSGEKTLANMFVAQLKSNFMQNKEHVTIVSSGDVEKFKHEHEDWKAMDFAEIAKQFGADYLISVELAKMSIYEQGSRDLFRARCRIPIRIVDSDKNAPEIFPPYDYETEYPGGGDAIQAGIDMSAERFMQKFFAKISVDMAGLFSATETSKTFDR
jgi:hypothetical protein